MSSYRIVSIIKPHPNSQLENITHIGYYQTAYNPKVVISIEEAVKRIESNPQEFYIRSNNKTIFATVERPADKSPFIKTTLDGDDRDNLMTVEQIIK